MSIGKRALYTLLAAAALGACSEDSDIVSPVDDGAAASLQAAHVGNGGSLANGVLYTSNNAPDGNEILVFARSRDGGLEEVGAVPTEGLGVGMGLGNQAAVTLSDNGRWLLAVNAGSDDVSLFSAGRDLTLSDRAHSGGQRPISVDVHGALVYVLNAGGVENVTGFRIGRNGDLEPIAGATYPLSQVGVAPAQVGFSPDGRRLVVTEKGTNRILVFPVRGDGSLGTAVIESAAGQTPFGFGFSRNGTLVVSEAFGGAPGASVVSSYRFSGDQLTEVSPLVATTQTAACWVVVTPNGRYAFSANTGSGSVSSFALAPDGSLTLLDAAAASSPGSASIDLTISKDGRFLHVLNAVTNLIATYSISPDGSLTATEDGLVTGLPAGTTGLAAR